jgi:hypothetical protein
MFGLAEFYHGPTESASARIFAAPTLREDEEANGRGAAKSFSGFTFA